MKGKISCVLIFVLSLAVFISAQTADELIAEGDSLCQNMQDMATAKEAMNKYLQALNQLESKYEALWRMSRILYYIGSHSQDKKDQQTLFSQGIYYGKKAVEAGLERPEGHYWLGVNYGKYGEVKGVLKSLSLVKPIKEEMNKVIELDRGFEGGGADKVLGRVYFKLPGFAGGNKEKSLEHLLKAKEFDPDDPLARLYLADTYLALNEVDKAKEELEFILSLEDDPRWVSDILTCKEEARNLLKDKKFKK